VPTFEWQERFGRDLAQLDATAREVFQEAVRHFVEDLQNGTGFRAGLRVKGVQGSKGVWEMTWAGDGRATFSYGPERISGQPHVIWRRIGTHAIFRDA
jgi:hypothetical protein